MVDRERRTLLAGAGLTGTISLAGCLDSLTGETTGESRPDEEFETATGDQTNTQGTPSEEPLPEDHEVVSVPGKNQDIRAEIERVEQGVLREGRYENLEELRDSRYTTFDELTQQKGDILRENPVVFHEDPTNDDVGSVKVDLLAMQYFTVNEYDILATFNPWMEEFVQAIADPEMEKGIKTEPPEVSYSNKGQTGGLTGRYFEEKVINAETSRQALDWIQELLFNFREKYGEINSTEGPYYSAAMGEGVKRHMKKDVVIDSTPFEMDHNVDSKANGGHTIILNWLSDLDEIDVFDTVTARVGGIDAHYRIDKTPYATPGHEAANRYLLPTRLGDVDNPGEEINVPDWADKKHAKVELARQYRNMTADGSTSRLFDSVQDQIALSDDLASMMGWGLQAYHQNDWFYPRDIKPHGHELNSYRLSDGRYALFLDQEYDGPGFRIDPVKVDKESDLKDVWTGGIQSKDELVA